MATLDLNGVFAVPPLPRRPDSKRTLDLDAAEEVARHVEAGGITRFLYGGNAFLYHATLGEFEEAHLTSQHYFILPGHLTMDGEDAIEENGRYEVVTKEAA